MTLSALQKFVLPPLIASGAVFAALTFPLATMGNNQVTIKLQEEHFFDGKVRDIATPYVIAATLMSLGAGISIAGFNGWRSSKNQSNVYEQELLDLEENLRDKEDLLRELKLSESRMQIAGLNGFLNEDKLTEASFGHPISATVSQPIVATTKIDIPEPFTSRNNSYIENSNSESLETYQVSYSQDNRELQNTNYSGNTNSYSKLETKTENTTTISTSEFEELQKQLRDTMRQVQILRGTIKPEEDPAEEAEKISQKFKVFYDAPKKEQAIFF